MVSELIGATTVLDAETWDFDVPANGRVQGDGGGMGTATPPSLGTGATHPRIRIVADDHGPSLQLAAPIDIGEIRCTEVSFFGRCAPWSHSQASASLHPQTLFGGVSSSTAAGTDPDPKAVSEKGGARCFSPGAQQWGLCGGHPAVPPQ